MNWEEEKTQIKYTIKDIRILRGKSKSGKPRSRRKIYYIIRAITGEEERTSHPLYIYNGMYTHHSP